MILTLQSVSFEMEKTLTLSLSLSLKVEDNSHQKVMETLTPKGVFIGLPTKLKWLESIKAFVT